MQSLLQLLRTEHETEHTLKQRKYSEPKIFHGGENYDLSKRWYVYYSYRNPFTGKMTRQRNIYMNVNADFHTQKDRLKALKAIQKTLSKLLKEGYSPYVDPETAEKYTVKNALIWALNLRSKTLSDTTASDYKSKLNLFISYLERLQITHIPVDEFKRKDVIDYLNEILQKNAAKTRNNHRIVLSSLFSVLKDNEIIPENIIEGISIEKTKSVRNKTYSETQLDDILKLIEKKDSELFLFIKIVAYNFLRPVEVVRLRHQDLKLNETPPYLEVRAKNKLEKIKIIPAILIPDLLKLSGDGLLFKTNNKGIETTEINRRNYFSQKFLQIKKELNLGHEYTMYSFRHTFITKLYRELRKTKNKLETEDTLMKITGHSTLKALQMYLRDIDAEIAEDYSHLLK